MMVTCSGKIVLVKHDVTNKHYLFTSTTFLNIQMNWDLKDYTHVCNMLSLFLVTNLFDLFGLSFEVYLKNNNCWFDDCK